MQERNEPVEICCTALLKTICNSAPNSALRTPQNEPYENPLSTIDQNEAS